MIENIQFKTSRSLMQHYFDNFTSKKSKSNLLASYLQTEEDSKLDSRVPTQNASNFNIETEKYVEDLKSGQNNILVAVRTRPLSQREADFSNFETIRVLDGKVVVLLDPQNHFDANDVRVINRILLSLEVFRNNRNKEKQYAFDLAFDSTVDTQTVFDNTTKFLIPGLLNGFNSTVFAYGATGAGKTYTMLGSSNTSGIMALTMNELYKQIQLNSENKDVTVKVSYLEVYNETLRDLLSSEDAVLDLREDAVRGIIVAGITEVIAKTSQEVMAILKIGSKNRTMEPTGANIVSSRSHAVLQVTVEHKDKNQGISEEITISKLSLIDLAGSERASNTNNRGQRLIEGANINKSLLALGNCITLLSDKADKGKQNVHIPYRDSKLTRLLKDSLGGNCRTVMIANVSPGVITFEDTHNTLKYANRAKNIKTSVSRNVLSVEHHIEKYTQIISDLKSENDHLKRLLQNGQNVGYGEMSPAKDIAFNNNETLINDIKRHFDEEMRMKRKIFEFEIQQDDIEDKLLVVKFEMNANEDKLAKERQEEYLLLQKKLPPQIEELKREYGYLSGKRAQINARIQNEKNKDTVTFLISIFKQNQMIIENMELQHKEKRVENQVKLKDRQIKYLQNQLGMRDVKAKEANHLRVYSNTPNLLNHKDTLNLTKDSPMPQDLQEESFSLLQDLHETDNSLHPNSKLGPQTKQTLLLPNVNYKVSKSSVPNSKRTQIVPVARRLHTDNIVDNPRHSSVKSLPPTYAQARYYYRKHEFMLQKSKPFEFSPEESRHKKRYAYMPPQDRPARDSSTNNSIRIEAEDENDDKVDSLKSRRLSLEKAIRRKSLKSLADVSHISTASSNKNAEKKKNILEDLNMRKDMQNQAFPIITKSRAVNPYTNKILRHGESPFLIKSNIKR